jgi:hypothetical protein
MNWEALEVLAAGNKYETRLRIMKQARVGVLWEREIWTERGARAGI